MNSIRVTLVVMLVAAFTLVSFLAALNGYLSSMEEVDKLLDRQLLHASDLLLASGENTDSSVLSAAEDKADEGYIYQGWRDGRQLVRSPGAPGEPIGELSAGYRYANIGGYRWRTLTRQSGDGTWYVLAERDDLRHHLVEGAVLESVLPLLLWLPVSALLVWILVAWGLRPLRDLSQQINLRQSDDLQPIEYQDPPAELKQLITSTNSLLARLSASFERERHFASHAAHELRTPLSVLKIHLHNLAGELPPGHEGLAHANAGLKRMHNLVEQILDLNRTNPDIIKAAFTPLDLHSLAQRVTADAWPSFSERDQVLSLEGDGVMMSGDRVMLEILLQNLLNNASKYTPAGGEIQVFAGSVEGVTRLVVEDSGPGIPAAEQDKVFQRFYRAGQERDTGATGSGLGLAIVQHIVQLHNASISLGTSQFGSGLAVTVDFAAQEEG